MSKSIIIKKTIKPFNKVINVEGDKSLSIRWALLASQAKGKSKSFNLLKSEDVIKITELLGDDTNKEKIISNKAFQNHLEKSISAFEKIRGESNDEGEKQYLSLRIEALELALNSSKLHCNSVKESLLSQFK